MNPNQMAARSKLCTVSGVETISTGFEPCVKEFLALSYDSMQSHIRNRTVCVNVFQNVCLFKCTMPRLEVWLQCQKGVNTLLFI
jgi:hypothetical protein